LDGLVVPPGNVAALRDALQRVLADPALAESLGHNARQTAKAMDPKMFYLAIFDLADLCASALEGTVRLGRLPIEVRGASVFAPSAAAFSLPKLPPKSFDH